MVSLWASADPSALDEQWDARAPEINRVVTAAQVEAARQATPYIEVASAGAAGADLVHEAFGGATREGREVAPELFSGVRYTKSLIGRGMGVGQAFRAGTALMSILAANTIRDAGRSADNTAAVSKGMLWRVRVVQPGACSRCAILAGVRGYRADFERHPACRCTSMPLYDSDTPDGFFRDPIDYFDSLGEAQQDRVFTKAGAWAIRNGADPAKVVNARRGALSSVKRDDGTFSLARLRPTNIGVKANGTPLTVYATPEGTTSRGWGATQGRLVKTGNDRYRRTRAIRLMPEQIVQMSQDVEHARSLLRKYGYLV
ncbi:hypothetical protein [Microbacterium jejuense]|uniref:hypothetical protein n=1 Tax=Microbacterium jejuense TaxID=1263637 RepID=UPI0031EFFA7D